MFKQAALVFEATEHGAKLWRFSSRSAVSCPGLVTQLGAWFQFEDDNGQPQPWPKDVPLPLPTEVNEDHMEITVATVKPWDFGVYGIRSCADFSRFVISPMLGKVETTEGSQPGEPTWMNALKVSKSPEGSASEWKLVKKLRKPQPREWTPLEATFARFLGDAWSAQPGIVVNSYTNTADKSAVILGYRSDELFFHYGTERKIGEEVEFYTVDVETTTPPIHLAVKPKTVHSNVLSSFKNKKYVVDFTVTRLGYNRRRHVVSTLGVVHDGRRLINEEHIRRHITVVVEGTGDADSRSIQWRVLGVCCPTQREIDELGFQELKAQLNEARSRNSVLHEDLAKLGTQLTQLQTAQEEAGEMQGRMRELQAEIAAKNVEMSALHAKIAELERDEETLTREPTTEEQEEVFVRRASEFWSNFAPATPENFQRQKEESMEEFIDRLLL